MFGASGFRCQKNNFIISQNCSGGKNKESQDTNLKQIWSKQSKKPQSAGMDTFLMKLPPVKIEFHAGSNHYSCVVHTHNHCFVWHFVFFKLFILMQLPLDLHLPLLLASLAQMMRINTLEVIF